MKGTKGHWDRKNASSREQWEKRKKIRNAIRRKEGKAGFVKFSD